MKLGIISDSHHYYDQENRLCNLSILAAQFECWASLFDEVIICAPLIPGNPPKTHSPYKVSNLRLIPISDAGGNTVAAKLNLLLGLGTWWSALHKLLDSVDAVHIRCPNNISIPGLIALKVKSRLTQALYTGTWEGYPEEPFTYRWQRLFLKNHFRGPVAVYGESPNQPAHIIPSFSPSYTQEDWQQESHQVLDRIHRLRNVNRLAKPVKVITIGSLSKNKNQQLIIQAMKILTDDGNDVILTILGGGAMFKELNELVQRLNLTERVVLKGPVSHEQVRACYRDSDFVIQAPYFEGFGKVPVEAFFHGAIPILSDVNLSSQLIGDGVRGRCFPQGDAQAIATHVKTLSENPAEMIRIIENGRMYAKTLTLDAWREHIRGMVENAWKVKLKIDPNETK